MRAFPFLSVSKSNRVILFLLNTLILGSCTIVRSGQVGVRQRLGTLSNQTHDQGIVWYWPIVSKVIKTNVQVQDIELSISLPSKKGLSVISQILILFKINQNKVPALIRNIGFGYQPIISNVLIRHRHMYALSILPRTCIRACALKLKKLSKSK